MTQYCPTTSEESLNGFLISMRLRLAERRWQLIEREKNLQAVSDLNMLVSDIPSVLRRITRLRTIV